MGYTKLFSSLIGSTIWREPDHVRLVWITMLALKDRHHIVESSVPGLADFARVSVEACVQALDILIAPDPHSRTTAHEGRRIEKVDGGWRVLNGEKYREKMNADERRESNRIYQQRSRSRKRGQAQPGEGMVARGADTAEVAEMVNRERLDPEI